MVGLDCKGGVRKEVLEKYGEKKGQKKREYMARVGDTPEFF